MTEFSPSPDYLLSFRSKQGNVNSGNASGIHFTHNGSGQPHALGNLNNESFEQKMNSLNLGSNVSVFESSETEELFCKSVPVMITSRGDQKTHSLTIRIEHITKPPHKQQILALTVTDETDPFFLYTLNVNESEFHALKSEQSLLVDFSSFPDSIIALLEQCLQSKESQHPKFVAVLRGNRGDNEALFCVQETNQFRHLQHIALRLRAGDDTAIKKYLAQYLINTKNELSATRHELHETQESLQRARLEKKQAQEYAGQVKQKTDQAMSDLRVAHAEQISQLKQEGLDRESSIKHEMEQDKNNMQQLLEAELSTTKKELHDLLNTHHTLKEEKLKADNELRTTKSALEQAESQATSAKEDLRRIRDEYQELDQLKFHLEKQLNQQALEIASLQQQVKDKSELLETSASHLETVREQKKALEESQAMYKQNLEKSEKKVRECVKEINKGNTIISHLQNEIRTQRGHVKSKKEQTQQFEQKLQAKQEELDSSKKELRDAEKKISDLRLEVKELNNSLSACKQKLETSHKAIESNQRVIQYLNKQVNSQVMNPSLFGLQSSPNTTSGGGLGMGMGLNTNTGSMMNFSSSGLGGIGSSSLFGASGGLNTGSSPYTPVPSREKLFSTLKYTPTVHDSIGSLNAPFSSPMPGNLHTHATNNIGTSSAPNRSTTQQHESPHVHTPTASIHPFSAATGVTVTSGASGLGRPSSAFSNTSGGPKSPLSGGEYTYSASGASNNQQQEASSYFRSS